MSIETWLAFCLTEAVLCFTPGPAVLLVVSFSLARGATAGLGAALGVLAANAFYFVLSALGVAAAIVASQQAFLLLKWAGAAYLVVVGLRMLFGSRARADAQQVPTASRSFVKGFVVQAANPKSLLFFLALVPQFISPEGRVASQVLILGVSSVAIELLALGFFIGLSRQARGMVGVGFAPTLERVGGGLLVAAGARLAAVRSD